MSSLSSTLLLIQQQIIRYLYSFYLIVGITGCCLNILLFSQRQFRTVSCCTYFLASSVAMIINLGLGIGSPMYALDHVDPNTSIVAFCKLRIYLNQFVGLTYRWCLTMACIDRYALSSTNVRFRNFARVSVARRLIGIIVIVCLIFPVHTLILYDIRSGTCGILYDRNAAIYHGIFSTMASCILPVSIMITCALLIRRNLARKRQRQLPTVNIQTGNEHLQRTKDQQVLIMLIIQAIVYVISVMPLVLFYLYNTATISITNKSMDRIAIERFCGFMVEVMVFIFPASSFYLYTLSSHTFRHVLIDLVRSILEHRWCNLCQNRIHPF